MTVNNLPIKVALYGRPEQVSTPVLVWYHNMVSMKLMAAGDGKRFQCCWAAVDAELISRGIENNGPDWFCPNCFTYHPPVFSCEHPTGIHKDHSHPEDDRA